MVREIMRDKEFLALPSEEAGADSIATADDLIDTLKANHDRCVGMAANMIGERKKVIVFDCDGKIMEMFNPVILNREGRFETEEGCLSLVGRRKAVRYKTIKVQWMTRDMKLRMKKFEGWTAQIIQHEVDHLSGIII